MGPVLTRKQFLAGAAATPAAVSTRRARTAPTYNIHLGYDGTMDHPIMIGMAAAAARIRKATDGQVNVRLFPDNQLGDDTHMLANLRSGAMQMMAIGDNILATLVPSAAIDNVGFAFRSAETAWAALDGAVGDIIRAETVKAGLYPMHHIFDQGFREITSSTKQINAPDDLRGFKMRVPPSPISLQIFQSLGASPVTINSAEVYTALQTHVADGQENPLGVIETLKFYQVQKYCALTDHMWVGFWALMNGAYWNSMPENLRRIVADAFDAEAVGERPANENLNNTLEETLKKQGLTFNRPDKTAFQAALAKSGFYKTWREKFGAPLWSALEKYTGPLG
jgi:tripartite ATP-independent transporter DctP family solute receptor